MGAVRSSPRSPRVWVLGVAQPALLPSGQSINVRLNQGSAAKQNGASGCLSCSWVGVLLLPEVPGWWRLACLPATLGLGSHGTTRISFDRPWLIFFFTRVHNCENRKHRAHPCSNFDPYMGRPTFAPIWTFFLTNIILLKLTTHPTFDESLQFPLLQRRLSRITSVFTSCASSWTCTRSSLLVAVKSGRKGSNRDTWNTWWILLEGGSSRILYGP
jgi:hypothetical protein